MFFFRCMMFQFACYLLRWKI